MAWGAGAGQWVQALGSRVRGARCRFWGAGWWPGMAQPCREVHANDAAPACLGPTFLPLPAMPPTPHTPPSRSPGAAEPWVPRPVPPCPGRLWCPASPAAACQAWHSSPLLLRLPQAHLQLPGTASPAPAPSHLPAPAPQGCPWGSAQRPCRQLPEREAQWAQPQGHGGSRGWVGTGWSPCAGSGFSTHPRQRGAQGGTQHPPPLCLAPAAPGTRCHRHQPGAAVLLLLFPLKI